MRVQDVRTMSVKSKPKRRGYTFGRTREWKKAIVQLPPDDTIEHSLRGPGVGRWPSRSTSPPARPALRDIAPTARRSPGEPEKSLVRGLKKSGGRNTHGRITSRHRGGGAKRRYRKIDFKRRKDGMPAKVAAIEYDPNRTAYIALLHYADGEKRYILAPSRLRVGTTVVSGPDADITAGNCLPLRNIPTGTVVHNVELTPGRGGQMGRSAGTSIQLMAKEGDRATLRLPSGEMRMVPVDCRATMGTIGNVEHQNIDIGKAGRNRHKGIRPQTRGTAMNPVDHPHGGGEGSTTPGRHPVTPWGVPTLGYPTRKKNKPSDRMHRAAPQEEEVDEPFIQEGTVGRGPPDQSHRGDELLRSEADDQDLVARVHDLPGDGGPHHRRP